MFDWFRYHKRLSALETWRVAHMAEIGVGGVAQRIEDIDQLRDEVTKMAEMLKGHDEAIRQAIKVGNDNVMEIKRALHSIEDSIRKQLIPMANAINRVQDRQRAVEIRLNEE